MAKLTVSSDGVVIKEIELSKARTTLGRRPYNDIVIDNLAVSGEHAVLLLLHEGQVTIEDLNSTNGTYVNGRAARSEPLVDGDLIEIGRYKIRFEQGQPAALANAVAAPATPAVTAPPLAAMTQAPNARVRVLEGPAAGREAQLVKEVTTLGKPGIAVVSITRRADGYAIACVGGQVLPRVNGREVDTELLLHDQDLIELAETRMQFLLG